MNHQGKSRFLSYDVIRIVAVLLVLLVHVSGYMVLYHPDTTSAEFFVGNLLNGISRAGVPLFVMLTGALLLNEDRRFDTKKFYKTSFVWMVLLLVGWLVAYGAFYAIVLQKMNHVAPSWSVFWNYLLKLPTSYPHLWYMFMVVGLYLMIPVLRLFVKRENKNYILGCVLVFVGVQLAVNTFNVLTRGWAFSFTTIVGKFHLEPATGFVGYALAGWYLSTFPPKKRGRLILYVLAIASVALSTYMVQTTLATNSAVRGSFYEPLTLTAFLYGAGVFVLISSLCGEKQTQSRVVATLSKCAFGAYIIHVFWMEMLTRWMPYAKFTPQNPLLYMELLFVLAVAASYATAIIGSLIPGVKKIFYIK